MSILSLLTFVGCIACFVAAFAERQQHIVSLEAFKFVYFSREATGMSNGDCLPLVGPIFQQAGFKYLECLAIYGIHDDQDEYLRNNLRMCQALKGLVWSKRPLKTGDVESIVGLPILTVLNFSRVEDCSAISCRAKEMRNLQVLTFSECGFPNRSFRELENAQSIEVIVFSKCHLNNVQIQWLRDRMPNTYVVCTDGE